MPQVMTILNCLHFDKIIFDPEVEVRCIPYRAIKIRGSDPGYVAIVLNLPVFYVVIKLSSPLKKIRYFYEK